MLPFDLQMRAFAAHELTPKRTISCSSAESILGFVEAGMGFSIVPSLDAHGPQSRGVVSLPLVSPRIEGALVAAWRKDTPENPLLDAALESAPKP